MSHFVRCSSFLLGSILAAGLPAQTGKAQPGATQPGASQPGSAQAEPATLPPLEDAPLAAYRRQLLEFAYDAVSAMPDVPHRKNRSRNQDEVVQVCLQLGQELLARQYIETIDDWRRGPCLADLAVRLLERGADEAAAPLLAEARIELERANDEMQPWRRDRLRAKLARATLLQGREVEARASLAGIDPVQVTEFEKALAKTSPITSLPAQIKALDRVIAAGDFDAIRGALQVAVVLHDRASGQEEQQKELEQRVLEGYEKMPALARLEIVTQLVEAVLQRGNKAAAQRLLQRCDSLLDGRTWLADDEYPWRGRVIALWGRAGANDKAKKDIKAALGRFYQERDRIPDIFRARCLRALAVASLHAGDRDEALRLLRTAAEEGVQNPNSKPRAEDLAALCLLMAAEDIEPDAALLARIKAIRKGLGNPW